MIASEVIIKRHHNLVRIAFIMERKYYIRTSKVMLRPLGSSRVCN